MKVRLILACLGLAALPALAAADASSPLKRSYREGETLTYRMTTVNEGVHYSAVAKSVATSQSGVFQEEITWSGLTMNGSPSPMTPAMQAYRQPLSLDPDHMPSPPDLSGVSPALVGPVTDLMTVYVDLWLANKFNALHKPGDHFYFPNPMTASWADGEAVVIGEDAVDFDMTLESVDDAQGTVVLLVRHVPPPQPKIHMPAPWMQAPVADTANNWVEVRKLPDGSFKAAVGQERFDVRITLDRANGRILKAHMDNPVTTSERVCKDAALTQCGSPTPRPILRKVDLELAP
ncbi:hypothetical protein MMA231_04335 (plasmid) [Asticcacaulis sp. MM231]|uniref:hypothetical protein n=1 Tax=Asticcacaulis sp. MM231 TaxID=3157666 RepID=UPI0032D568EC